MLTTPAAMSWIPDLLQVTPSCMFTLYKTASFVVVVLVVVVVQGMLISSREAGELFGMELWR